MRAGLQDANDQPQWRMAAFGTIESLGGVTSVVPFAMTIDDEHARYLDAAQIALIEAEAAEASALLSNSGAWTALQWLSEWETLVGGPLVDDTPRVAPISDGTVQIDGSPARAIYVDLAEFPSTYAFGAWWYLGVDDPLPRRLELVYYDVRTEESRSVGDGITRLTISDLVRLDTPAEVAEAVARAAGILDEVNWREAGEEPISALLDASTPFALPAPEGFRTLAYEPPADARRARAPAEPEVDIPAPDFTLLDSEGNAHTLSQYRGKIVILDFWATWCGPCLVVMPHLQAIHEAYREQDVVVIGINAWENGDPAALMRARNWDYLLLLNGDQVASDYQVSGIPTMVVIDQSGTIVQRKVGAGPNVEQELTDTIMRLQSK